MTARYPFGPDTRDKTIYPWRVRLDLHMYNGTIQSRSRHYRTFSSGLYQLTAVDVSFLCKKNTNHFTKRDLWTDTIRGFTRLCGRFCGLRFGFLFLFHLCLYFLIKLFIQGSVWWISKARETHRGLFWVRGRRLDVLVTELARGDDSLAGDSTERSLTCSTAGTGAGG